MYNVYKLACQISVFFIPGRQACTTFVWLEKGGRKEQDS